MGSFGEVKDRFFPVWFAVLALGFIFFESRKQYRRYFKKGAAKLFGCVEMVNYDYDSQGEKITAERLMERTEDLTIYSMAEFNDKVGSC